MIWPTGSPMTTMQPSEFYPVERPSRLFSPVGSLRSPALVIRRLPSLLHAASSDRSSLPVAVRRLLVDLGPTYIKLGQVLSTRRDALSPEWIAELAGLRDAVPAESADTVQAILARSYPDGVDSLFAEFSPTPLAAGAVAQVHTARLLTGERVAVKLLRPDVEEHLESDSTLLLFLASALQRVSRSARVLNMHGLVSELCDLLRSQTDLRSEARNYRLFRREFADHKTVLIPRTYDSLTRREVLVTELVEGIDPYDIGSLTEAPRALANRFDDLIDTMLYLKGLCHADLHPGNFFWSQDGRIVLVDLGLVHRISEEERNHLLTFYMAVLDGFNDFAAGYVVRHLTAPTQAGRKDEGIPEAAIADMRHALRTHWEESNGRPQFAAMFRDLLRVLATNSLQLRHNYSRLFLTLATVEGYLYSIDPGFNMLDNARRKRVEAAEYVGIPVSVEALAFADFGTYSTAMFQGSEDAQGAYAQRDQFILDSLHVDCETTLLDVGCGRGQLLKTASARGANAVGITISRAEYQACLEEGVAAVLTGWETADQHLAKPERFDAMTAIEMDPHLSTLRENEAGLAALRLERFFGWARSRLTDDGKLFLQTLSVSESFIQGADHREDFLRFTKAVPWIGFSTLPQVITCSDPFFAALRIFDHSEDLMPTFAFWRDRINRQLPAIRALTNNDELVVILRRQIDALIGLADGGQLQLYRLVLKARSM